MYTNVAYLGGESEDIIDSSRPLLISAVGYYRPTTKEIRTYRPHGRGDYQLLYIADGQARFTFDGKEKRLGRGEMVLFRPDAPQIYRFCGEDAPQIYWVHFTGSEAEDIVERYRLPKDGAVFFAGASSDYERLYRHMIRELQLRRVNCDKILCADLEQIFMLVDRYFSESYGFATDMLDEVERAIRFFNESYNSHISIEEYAKRRYISPCWFIRTFSQVTRLTPLQYIISLRIANAKTLLENTTYNVSQIAYAVGYDNALYFSRLFKKHTGTSPKEYRERAKARTR